MKQGLAAVFTGGAACCLAAGLALAQDAPSPAEYCRQQDQQNARIVTQLFDVFAQITGSPVSIKAVPGQGAVMEGAISTSRLSPQTKKEVAELLTVTRNVMAIADPSCLYTETATHVDVLLKAADEYLSLSGQLEHSL